MNTTANHHEIQQAREFLQEKGYEVGVHENGHLIVQDPVMRCGIGSQSGRLILAGYQPVAVRNLSEAFRFSQARDY